MEDNQAAIDEMRPMLEELLCNLHLHHASSPLDLRQLLEPFSQWVDQQEVTDDDRNWLTAQLAAFICEYLIDVRSGQRTIQNGRVAMRVPIQAGVWREFDPYAVAFGMATNRSSLKEFL